MNDIQHRQNPRIIGQSEIEKCENCNGEITDCTVYIIVELHTGVVESVFTSNFVDIKIEFSAKNFLLAILIR